MGTSNKSRTLISTTALLLSIVLLGGAAPAAASSLAPIGITMSPPLQQLTIGPGLLQANANITLKNNTSHLFTAGISTVDFKALNEYGGITLAQVGKPIASYGLANWMSLPGGNHVSLAPGQAANVPVVIQNRDDLTPGGHYGAVVVTATDGANVGHNTVGFNQELVSLVYLKKLGGDIYGLQLTSLQTQNRAGGLPSQVTLRFKSIGNVYVIPRGYIEITDAAGKLVSKGIINTASSPVMQGTAEQLVTLMQTINDTGRAGRYKLTVYYRYDGASQYQIKSISFTRGTWSVQTTVILIFIGVILLLLMYKVLRMKQRHRAGRP